MKAMVEWVKPRLPRAVRAPLASTASYLRGRRTLRAYSTHYRRARQAFGPSQGAGAVPALPAQFGVHLLAPTDRAGVIELPDGYMPLVRRIGDESRGRFEHSAGLTFFPRVPEGELTARTADIGAVRRGDVIIMRIAEPAAIDGVRELSAAIVERLEQRVFGSHAIVDRVFLYRSPVSRQRPRASWLWHYDNYPREILKVMIYLSEVCDDTAPFEYLRHVRTGAALPGTPLSPGYGDSRLDEAALARLARDGYQPHRVTGPAGTMLIFDNNVVHRATLAERAHRDVLVLQVRPAVAPGFGVVDPAWTGSFQHSGFNLDPDDHRLS
jgi:hypothetical protein